MNALILPEKRYCAELPCHQVCGKVTVHSEIYRGLYRCGECLGTGIFTKYASEETLKMLFKTRKRCGGK